MEKGRWGHNSTFSEEQIRVPLIFHIPGETSREILVMTSHVDIPATILAALGVTHGKTQIGFGNNLLARDYNREYVVVSDWHGNALISKDTKYIMSSKAIVGGNRTTTIDDIPLSAEATPNGSRMLRNFFKEIRQFK
jgi:membrane-anchored protein YejM (alkaline phosphatase superfamily)